MTQHGEPVALRRNAPAVTKVIALVTIFLLVLSCGCALFPNADVERQITARKSILPPLKPAPDAIQLEVLFVERSADDPVLGRTLWREVDQIAAVPGETRELLEANGLLVGHVGSSPPPVIQSLLGLSRDVDASEDRSTQPLVGRRKTLPSGGESELQTRDDAVDCELKLVQGDKVTTNSYVQARSILRMKSTRLKEGWVRIDFVPEVHHGEMLLRHTPGTDGWAFRSRQNVEGLPAHQFSLTMNVGEMAIVTAAPEHAGTLGDFFFRRTQDGVPRQRVLFIRVAHAGDTSPIPDATSTP